MLTKYMERVRLKTLPPAISVFGSYLNVIAQCGNIQGIPEMSAYGTYLRNGQGSESVLDADVDGTVSSAMGCEVFHILWN